MLDLKSQFIAWLDTMPADGEYDFYEARECAFAQFEKAIGTYRGERHGKGVCSPGEIPLPDWAAAALADWPRTFGALRARLTEQAV